MGAQRIGLTSLLVRDYDEAIAFFVGKLGFDLVEDSPSLTSNGDAKRWVVVAPAGGGALLLARAATPEQEAQIGNQAAGRVFLFLYTDDFERDYNNFRENGVEFTRSAPRSEAYGTVAVFRDVSGNLWDLIEPALETG